MAKKQSYADNNGFTLIEVLIAMIILAIIVVPLLHTFVSSARTNQQARARLRATTAAQDIMEGLKACTVEELAYQFNYPDASHAANPLIDEANEFHVINRSLVSGTIKEVLWDGAAYQDVVKGEVALNKTGTTASMYSIDHGVEYEFLGQTSGNYYFEMQDMSVMSDQSINYDALIHLDANPYRAAGSASYKVNDEEIISIREMNNLYDAFYVETENDTHSAILYMNAMGSPVTPVQESDIFREITIDVDKQVISGSDVIIGNIYIKYTAYGKGHAGADIEYEPLGAAGKQIFSNVSSGMELRNVYLFYYPIYYGTYGLNYDTITFNNPDDLPLTFHVIKQEPSSVDSTLTNKETNYHCDLNIEDGTGNLTKVRTNLTRNLFDAYSGTVNAKPIFIRFFLDGAAKSEADFGAKNLAGVEQTDRLFDVTINLYEPGAAAAGYPDNMRLTTLVGSKNN